MLILWPMRGVKVHGEEVYSLARMYSERHKCYTAFMVEVSTHIVEAHLIHRELLRISEAKLAKQESGQDKPLHFFKPCSTPPLAMHNTSSALLA